MFAALNGEVVIAGADRYRKHELLDALTNVGVAPRAIHWRGLGGRV